MKTLQQQCYLYALKLLSKRAYSSKRLMQKLHLKFTQMLKLQANSDVEIDLKHICQQCIDKLLEKNYLNDEDYTQMLLRNYAKYGQNRLKQLLNQQGLQNYMHLLIEDSNNETAELDKALQSLSKKFTQKLYQMNDANLEAIDIDMDTDSDADVNIEIEIDEIEIEFETQINQNQYRKQNIKQNIKQNKKKAQTKTDALKFQQKCIRFLVQQGFNYTIAMQAFKNFITSKAD